MSDLKDILNSYQPACVALQETHLKPENSLRLHGYTVFRKDHPANRASGGVALLISNNIPSSLLTLNTPFQAIAAQIFTHKLITVCSLYLPPNTHIDQTNLNNLMLQLPEPFVILGDLNGHSQIWGSDDTNSRGRQIEKLLHDHNLCLLNTHEITHFHTPTRTFHSIDLAICSPSLLPFFCLQTDPDLHNSDHFPIILTDNRHSHLQTVFSRFKYDLANWTKFTSTACITKTMVCDNPIDTAVNQITETLIAAAENSIPKTKNNFRRQRKVWWNSDCREAYKTQRKAWGRFRRYPTTANLILYKQAKAYSRRIQRRSQRESWERYVSSLNSTISSKKL
ncbi:hypothetical protein AVEN_57348-1, partial [Araneus ventricosus]